MIDSKISSVIKELLINKTPINDIIQPMTKTEVDSLQECLLQIGQKLTKTNKIEVPSYNIEGVKSTGFLPEGHPERQLVIKHINKLLALPLDHPHKNSAMTIARLLQAKHLDRSPKPPVPLNYAEINKPKQSKEQPETIDYSTFNKPSPAAEPTHSLDYAEINKPKQSKEQPKTIDYSKLK